MARRNDRSRRGRRPGAVTSLHWFNLLLYVAALVIVLVGVKAFGDGAAEVFFDVAAPANETLPHDNGTVLDAPEKRVKAAQ